ncbi:MAG: type I restriction-modification system subunit M [Clostridium sp.]|nr:type I restriction-modification system subunit M [Clostridium sp.]MCM1443726.1 type I restriction-modification system subunit M [Candidatus Amulumruptor caecigallinarius]
MNDSELKSIEDTLWASADKMRGAVSVSDYKFIVLGLIFLKYISDSFEERYKELVEEGYGLEEEKDSYTEKNIFYVPKNARWSYLVEHSKDENIGEIVDDALTLIEKDNSSLKNVLPKNYNSPTMRNVNLGELIDLFTNIKVGTKDAIESDILGRIYEYFLGQFAKNELQKGGEFYTPACLVRTMVECIEPYEGRVYDPACGSGGMFIQSLKFVQEHQGNISNIGIYGQEKNPTTWRLAKMNLAIRSLNGDLGKYAADTFTEDLHKDLKADFILANPPFNLEWDVDKVSKDPRWRYGLAPKNNANYAWLQHMISKLSQNGKMACILANGSLSASGQESEIRKKLLDNDLVDCILSMPSNLFYTVTVPCSIWIINRNKKKKGHTLFINASNMGTMVTRKLRELSKEEILKIADTYRNYQNDTNYEDILGYCKKATLEEIQANDCVLTPGRYVGIEEQEDDGVPFEDKMTKLTQELSKQFEESHKLEEEIKKNLEAIGYGI